ncbi:VanW family protein [Clostridium lundense]|uniref:VanW family protein n=1 Tax=Clostridium lundense TaxID=319475 RepID=UPI00048264F2|nr:VanW family protein [Clostridium lundense]
MKKFGAWLVIIFILLIASISYPISQYYYTKNWEDKIYPTTFINDIDVSGKRKDEAIKILNNNFKKVKDTNISVKAGNKTYTLQLSKANPKYNIEDVVNDALSYGKNLGLLKKANEIKNPKERKLSINVKYDTKYIEKFISNIEKDINKPPSNASIKITSPSNIYVTKDVKGVRLNKKDLMDSILSKINTAENNNNKVIAKIETYSGNITEEKLRQINSIVSSFSTNFGNSPEGRVTNIQIATNTLNGILIMPGDTFSFNKLIGNTTAEKGYKEAPIIINNKLEAGIGGGLCQVSTTLYNAIIRCNIKSIERTNHSIAPAYIEPGFDATVSNKDIDYKFKNTLSYPIYIEGYTNDGKITFNVYSNSSFNKVKYNLVNEIYEKTDPKKVEEPDPTLPKGTIKKVQSPKPGCKVKVFLVRYENNKEVSRELISTDLYKPSDEIIKIGTKS